MRINVLDSEWTIIYSDRKRDSFLVENNADGYCEIGGKLIVINTEFDDWSESEAWIKKNLRHEIIHAFLLESGIAFESIGEGHCEAMIDWFAIQYPKIQKVFEEVGCL